MRDSEGREGARVVGSRSACATVKGGGEGGGEPERLRDSEGEKKESICTMVNIPVKKTDKSRCTTVNTPVTKNGQVKMHNGNTESGAQKKGGPPITGEPHSGRVFTRPVKNRTSQDAQR